MARHHHKYHRRHRRHHRHNPFGVSTATITDAMWTTGGALSSLWLVGMFPQFSAGWTGVLATGAAAVVASFAGKAVAGARAGEELLKGGLVATIIKALHNAGVASNLGLGLYAPSWFGVPTASSQYLQAAQANLGPYRRGYGTIFFPGPGAAALPAAAGTAIHPAAAAAAGQAGMGFHRFRSRYAGNY